MNNTGVLRKIFVIFNYIAFTIFALLIVVPFVHAIAVSFSDYQSVTYGHVKLLPINPNAQFYLEILTNGYFLISFGNTTFLTIVNTFLVIIISLAAGYVLGNKHMPGRKILMYYVIIPMYFSGGMIPFYLTVRDLHLYNTYGALILPAIVNIFYIIVFRNSIAGIPAELTESAELDGAGDFTILFRILLPVILPMVTAFIIFSAIAYWNEWYNTMLFIKDKEKYTMQYWLRNLLMSRVFEDTRTNPYFLDPQKVIVNEKSREMAAVLVTILPITIVYPFLQKYFIHGIIVGAVKG